MTNDTKGAVAVRPANDQPLARFDRTIDGAQAPVAGALAELARGLNVAIGRMNPDDVTLDVDTLVDGEKSSARLRLRAYRRAQQQ